MSRLRRTSVFLLLLGVGFACRPDALAPEPTASTGEPRFSTTSPPDPLAPPGHIVFVRILPPSARWVFRMDATGANVTQLANGYAPTWKPDGTKIAFNCGANICVMNADGSGIVQLTFNVVAEASAWSAASAAFPDGRIAFDQQDASGNWHIYVMNPDGTGVTQLTTDLTIDGNADWSPDASRLAFQRHVKGGVSQVYVMSADGSGVTQLTTGGGSSPAWSPDGTRITFDSNRSGTGQVYVMSSSGEASGVAQVSTGGGSTSDWSPDGTWIVFTCPGGKTTDICAINSDGTRLVDLTNSRTTEQWPEWGP
jgi:Tol biopolymer transport system component